VGEETVSRVTLTIHLELATSSLPSGDALSAAICRAEQAACRVFVCGDRGGAMHVKVDESTNPIEKTCDAVDILPGRMSARVSKRKRG
jgi:hypothetical protein